MAVLEYPPLLIHNDFELVLVASSEDRQAAEPEQSTVIVPRDCFFRGLFFLPARSVEDGERPFALGMQFVLLRTLGKSYGTQPFRKGSPCVA